MRGLALAVGVVLALGGCSKTDNAPRPGDVSLDEQRALSEAADMLAERPSEPAPTGQATGE